MNNAHQGNTLRYEPVNVDEQGRSIAKGQRVRISSGYAAIILDRQSIATAQQLLDAEGMSATVYADDAFMNAVNDELSKGEVET